MERYHLPQPRISNQDPNPVFDSLFDHPDLFDSLYIQSLHPYLPWKKFELKFKSGAFNLPNQPMISVERLWSGLKFKRLSASRPSPVMVYQNQSPHHARVNYFRWVKTPFIEKTLHDFDMNIGGSSFSPSYKIDQSSRDFFIRKNIIEEAIASSQLEGAATTRSQAKQMLRENRRPRTRDERMIFNNYQTILKIEREIRHYPLSRDVLLDLHQIMTQDTLENVNQIGRWRNDDDEIVIQSFIDGEDKILHVPPKQDYLQQELDRFISYANDQEADDQYFTHPVIKALILHFWFAYIHPFCDGNGRLSRSIFFWYLLRHDYHLVSYLPISKLIKDSAGQYRDAFLYTEQYGNDLTYFIDYNLTKITQSLQEFDRHVETVKNRREQADLITPDIQLNDRQKQLINHFIVKPNQPITARKHADFHQVTWITGKNDLKELQQAGYLQTVKKSKEVLFVPTDKLLDATERLK